MPNTAAHIIVGSFRTSDIYVLRFTYVAGGTCTLKIISAYSGNGPHTYLTYNQKQTNLYTTSSTGHLTSWRKGTSTSDDGKETPVLSFQNTVKRDTVASYLSVRGSRLYSVGKNTINFHTLRDDGSIESPPAQEIPNDGHSAEVLTNGTLAFIPTRPMSKPWGYRVNPDGTLTLADDILPPPFPPGRAVLHPSGVYLYVASNSEATLNVYKTSSLGDVQLAQTVSLIPQNPGSSSLNYFGSTVALAQSIVQAASNSKLVPSFVYATAIGNTSATKGYISAFALDGTGLITDGGDGTDVTYPAVQYYPTATSGGQALSLTVALPTSQIAGADLEGIALSEDEQGTVTMLQWSNDAKMFTPLASTTLPGSNLSGGKSMTPSAGTSYVDDHPCTIM